MSRWRTARLLSVVTGLVIAILLASAPAQATYDLWYLHGSNTQITSRSCRSITVGAHQSFPGWDGRDPTLNTQVWNGFTRVQSVWLGDTVGYHRSWGSFLICPSRNSDMGVYQVGPTVGYWTDRSGVAHAISDPTTGRMTIKLATVARITQMARQGRRVTIVAGVWSYSVDAGRWVRSTGRSVTLQYRGSASGPWLTVRAARTSRANGSATFSSIWHSTGYWRLITSQSPRTWGAASAAARG